MPRQDIDPLADTQPPRYSYESDDEDELDVINPSSDSSADASSVEVRFLPPAEGENDKEKEGTLIIASGGIGVAWARGASLGEQVGQVNVNKRAIGLIFRPAWARTNGTIIISEAFTRLPVIAMNPYARAVLDRWNPSKVVLLDAYSTATYISPEPIPHHAAPLRYLSTERKVFPNSSPLSFFAPPNLIQSTTAAFLNLLALPSSQKASSGLALLVPSRRAPLPSPKIIPPDEDESTSATLSVLSSIEDSEDWDPALLRQTHHAALEAASIHDRAGEWTDPIADRREKKSAKPYGRRRLTETEEGMYI
ncbi:hypothetical protein A7U60_g900 [Sanghuangporus baumii]|uniref:Proteasome assembly chaperone 1 n=1 Tax=Sanghuangporus baumii TaxID=108892 RepID=A0A9Q5I5F9_SANBA|nr:hypothetical protein A7U60_g900 [Sanghuangporus baumii]